MDYLKAFLVGGLICALVQILMEKTKMMPGRIMVLLVCSGAVLGAAGLYGPFQELEIRSGRALRRRWIQRAFWESLREALRPARSGYARLSCSGIWQA